MTDERIDAGSRHMQRTDLAGAYYAAGDVPPAEPDRLEIQSDTYAPLAEWTLDALHLNTGCCVLELGCGTGSLLTTAAQRVGPTGNVVGVDRDPTLLAVARERMAAYPWVELVEADALGYDADPHHFDAVHCRLVLLHQADPNALLAQMVALTRVGGRIATQDIDADGLTDAPVPITCYPPLAALEQLSRASVLTRQRLGTDDQAGRKALDRFARLGLGALEVASYTPVFPLTDRRLRILIDREGWSERVAATGVMPAAEFEALLADVRRAHEDPAYHGYLVRCWPMIATVGRKP
jgi:SAM-dependent methyltransferase